jgi:hypothetical protein
MTQTEPPTTGKAAAAAAAKKMLEERINLVTTLGDAIDNHRRAGDTVTAAKAAQEAAAEAARAAHADAVAGGWTAAELRNAGLVVPAGPRRARGAPGGTAAPAEHQHPNDDDHQ